jgi:hypothetical protein
MSFTESHEMEGTLEECLRQLVSALGHQDFEVAGDDVIVRDKDKRFVISLTYEGDRRLGSLDLPMTRVDLKATGCTEAEAMEFHDHIAKHLMRVGG